MYKCAYVKLLGVMFFKEILNVVFKEIFVTKLLIAIYPSPISKPMCDGIIVRCVRIQSSVVNKVINKVVISLFSNVVINVFNKIVVLLKNELLNQIMQLHIY